MSGEELRAVPAQESERRARWPWISLLPIGLGAWAPIYAGVRARRLAWVVLGVVWSLLVLAGYLHDALGGHPGHDDLAGGLMIVGWVGAIATSFTIRSEYERAIASPLLEATGRAELRLADRERARQLAARNPRLAAEVGIGRPDEPGAVDSGLVDVNNASAPALEALPGIDGALATRIVEMRALIGGFTSVEDLGIRLDLDGHAVEALRERSVFLPRQP